MWDTSIFKSFMVYKVKTEIRANLFNVLNTPQFATPNGEVSSGSSFGQLNTPLSEKQRELELMLRISF